jgi:Zn-dependent alcohol dehydrogenase
MHSVATAENSNVAVFGVGCVGLSILQGARAKKCAKVIAIDTNPSKKDVALKFGASKYQINAAYHFLADSVFSHLQPNSSTPRTSPKARAL